MTAAVVAQLLQRPLCNKPGIRQSLRKDGGALLKPMAQVEPLPYARLYSL